MKSVLVVGSGPSALATVKELVESRIDLEITILDTTQKKVSANSVGLKSFFGSTDVYDQVDSDLHHINLKPVVWPSTGPGGFSRIWGAVVGQLPSDNFYPTVKFGRIGDYPKLATASALRIRRRYSKVQKPTWILLDHIVAVDAAKCNSCGSCLTGCPTDAIWFAGNEWQKIGNLKIESNFRVKEIKTSEKFVTVISTSGAELSADSVFLAAGAISSTQILMRSQLIPESVLIQDTGTVFFPALRVPRRDSPNSFALSQLSATLQIDNHSQSYVQFYPDSRNLTEPLKQHSPWLGRLFSGVWKWVSPFIMTGILYNSSQVSASLRLRMTDSNSFELSKSNEQVSLRQYIKVHRISRSIVKDFGVLPLFFLAKKAEPGESYHFGAIAEVKKFNDSSKSSRIKVVDASALPHIEAGPITDIVMQNARKIVREHIRETYEISN